MFTAEALERHLFREIGRPVRLTLTRNRRTFISCRHRSGHVLLRLHEVFLTADAHVIHAVERFVQGEQLAATRRTLRGFFDSQRNASCLPRARPVRLSPAGKTYDLEEIRAELDALYFSGESGARITWGRSVARRRSGRIRLGSYDFVTGIIRVHPILDQANVPRCVVEQTVHHEMVHARLGVRWNGRRRILHAPDFRELERRYQRFEEAQAWLNENLEELLANFRRP